MKIGILSRNRNLYSTRRLVEEAQTRGHEVRVIDVLKCYMNITANDPTVYYQRSADQVEPVAFEAVIPRIGASVTAYGCAVLRQFEVGHTYSINESIAITRSRDKLRAHQLLARRGIGQPVTAYAHSARATDHLIESVGGAPLILKLTNSTHGNGVLLAETKKAAEALINAFRGIGSDFLVQEFIKEAGGSDIRCFVVGEKVIAAMQRKASKGEYRSNLHRGGTAEVIKLQPEERRLAIRAAKVMGLDLAGVDILRSAHGPLVIEVNSSPGLEGIETATGINVASKIIDYVEKDSQAGPNKPRGRG
ncbi:30S ribosomal protein S6--L-glutamate ligase [Parahaliea aestuarii]|uniref:Probable alpha-L-glutamate ligase n=1 Tax=Parahaliea aestuarii TaxID=1852021 RepID=A0A5C8ZQU6_9GAMM|nr:30S ribosomal protein S6--L-glutamate ligase [Parahaliea aestuarii]TXS90002.1 30S ribosomal protein S6--L-glutamate ligase [Parahaliea aestuarii]